MTEETRMPPPSVALTIHDVDTDLYSLRVEFERIGGGRGQLDFPRGDTKRPTEIVRGLENAGAILPRSMKPKDLIDQVTATMPSTLIRTTKRGGWHGNSCFMQPHWSAGTGDLQWAQGNTNADAVQGTAKAWKKGLEKPCARSPFLCFSIGVAFAGPLMQLVGEDEGATFNLHGTSSSGKSLSSRACQSVFTRASKVDLCTYGASKRGLEELCYRRNDLAVVLDDEAHLAGPSKKARSHEKTAIAFKIAGGSSDARSEVSGMRPMEWRTMGLTSGEQPLGERGRGEMVRHIDIAIGQHPAGIFTGLGVERGDIKIRGAVLAAKVEETIANNFGVAMPAFVDKLIIDYEGSQQRARELRTGFVDEVKASASWDRRLASKFGIVFAGMVLAARSGVAPWEEARALPVVKTLYLKARADQLTNDELASEIFSVIGEEVAAGSIPEVRKGRVVEAKPLGFIRKIGGRRVVAVNPLKLGKHWGCLARIADVARILSARGIALPGTTKSPFIQLQVKRKKSTVRSRWLCIPFAALDIEAGSEKS